MLTALLSGSATVHAGAVDQTCALDAVSVGSFTFELKKPKRCPPGDILLRERGRTSALTLARALWVDGFGKTRLPALVDDQIVWLQADGDRALLRITRLPSGETFTLGRGGFEPGQIARSGRYLAIGESRDPLPADIRRTIPHRMVVIDLSAKAHPTLLPGGSQPPWPSTDLALEHLFERVDEPGAFWFLLTGLSPSRPSFRVGRWRDGVTQFATFDRPDYGSYAYLAIAPACGLVAWNACDALHDRTQGCSILVRGVDQGQAATLPLPDGGYVSHLTALKPDSLSYSWVSNATYAEEMKVLQFRAPCQP